MKERTQRTGYSSTHTFIIYTDEQGQSCNVRATKSIHARMYSQRNANKELLPNKAMYMHSHVGSSNLLDTAPQHTYKNPKEKKGLPFRGR